MGFIGIDYAGFELSEPVWSWILVVSNHMTKLRGNCRYKSRDSRVAWAPAYQTSRQHMIQSQCKAVKLLLLLMQLDPE